MTTQTIWKQFSCVTDVRVIGQIIPREFLCAIGVHRKDPVEAPELHN